MKTNYFYHLIGIVFAFHITACSTQPEDRPTSVTYSMVATNTINLNVSGQATPLEYQVFELQDDSMFLSADFDQLTTDAKAALKSSYISHRDYVLIPGQFKFVESFELDKDTFYLVSWRAIQVPIQVIGKKSSKCCPKRTGTTF